MLAISKIYMSGVKLFFYDENFYDINFAIVKSIKHNDMKKYLLRFGVIIFIYIQAFTIRSANYGVSEIRAGVSHAVPVDLQNTNLRSVQMPPYVKGKQEAETSELYRKSKNTAVNLIGFKAVTEDYGQLKSILEANKGTEIDSLVVVGPMNKDDFKAIWDCAVYGNMHVLNLENATMENNAIPDYALYDPIQFETGFWLKIRRIILPEGIIGIGKAAFPFMGLEEINIPSTVREIGSTAFGYDRWLNCELIIPE